MMTPSLPKSLVDNPRLNQWVDFSHPGRATVRSGKVEIGQGILTALRQIAAEELDLHPDQIDLVAGQTDSCPDEGFTAGSYSVSVGGASLRLACADVRRLFIQAAAARLGCPEADLSISDGTIVRGGHPTGLSYWSLRDEVSLDRAYSGEARPKEPETFRWVGHKMPRLDLPAKLSGGGFIHDLHFPDMLHARVVRQQRRGRHIVSIDERALARAAGQPIELLRDKDFLAILGTSESAVYHASKRAETAVTWEGGESLPSDFGSIAWLKSQEAIRRVHATGKPDADNVAHTISAEYSRPCLTYGSIGPSCAYAVFADGKLTVWSHTQGPAVLREWLAITLDLSPEQVTVIHAQGAGAYGHNTADDAAFDAAFIAMRRPGKTIRVLWNREDEFSSAPISPAMVMRLSADLDKQNRPLNWRTEIWSPPHVQRPGLNGNSNLLGASAIEGAPPLKPIDDLPHERGGGATRNSVPMYQLGHFQLTHHMIPLTTVRTSSLRGLGTWANVFAIESFIDELAEHAGVDPARYRLDLLADARARKVIEEVCRMSDWFGRPTEIGTGSAKGLGFARYKNIAAYVAIVAEVTVEEDVRVDQIWCAADAGLTVNPDGAENQIEGGIIQALSFSREKLPFEDGAVSARSWRDYPILRFSDIPPVQISWTGSPYDPAVGVGEASVGPTVAAVANAVARALGQRIRRLPINRETIMETLLGEG